MSCPSLLEEEVEGLGPGEPRRGGGDMLRASGGVEVCMDEMRGEDGPPFADKGGEGNGRNILDVAVDPFEEAESKAPSNFSAWEGSTPPKVSSNEMPASRPSEALRVGQVSGWAVVEAELSPGVVSTNENGFEASVEGSEGAPLLAGTPKILSNPLTPDREG